MKKKIIAGLTSAALLSSLAAPAFAATFSDVTDAKVSAAADRLAVLKVINGTTDASGKPTGQFAPDAQITRAEFAAIAVRALGLESASSVAKGTTGFSDVSADHWASGYINVAASQGIIKGYGDSTFGPDNKVTYAEALTILVRALGYEPVTVGGFPSGYVAKAATLGLINGVTVNAADAAATRGAVAQFVNNALDVNLLEQYQFGGSTGYQVSTKTLLTDKLGVTNIKGALVTSAARVNANLTANQVELTYGTAGTKVIAEATGFDATDLLGRTVDAWVTSDNKLVTAKQTKYTEKTGRVESYTNVGASVYNLTLQGSSTVYTVDATAQIYVNNVSATVAATTLTTGDSVRISVDNNNSVKSIDAFDYDNAASVASQFVVTKVDGSNVTATDVFGGNSRVLTVSTTSKKDNGSTLTATDLTVGGLYTVTLKSDDTIKFAHKAADAVNGALASVTGVYSATTSSRTATINVGGTDYSIGLNAHYSTDGGTTISATPDETTLSGLAGQQVTVYLGADGRVVYLQGTATSVAASTKAVLAAGDAGTHPTVPLTINMIYKVDDANGSSNYVRLIGADGVRKAYKVTADTVFTDGTNTKKYSDLVAGDTWLNTSFVDDNIAKYALNDDGTLAKISTTTQDSGSISVDPATTGFNGNLFTVNLVPSGTKTFTGNDSTIVVDNTTEASPKLVKYSDFVKATGTTGDTLASVRVTSTNGAASFISFKTAGTATVGASNNYALVTGHKVTSAGNIVTLNVNGTATDYVTTSGATGWNTSDAKVVKVIFSNGKVSSITDLTSNATDGTKFKTLTSVVAATYDYTSNVDTTNLTVTVNEAASFATVGTTKTVFVSSKAVVYDAYNGVVSSFSRIPVATAANNWKIQAVDTDGDGIADIVIYNK